MVTARDALDERWTVGEKCRRKGGNSMITYFVADTSETGVLLKTWKGGQPVGIGRWHSWKIMQLDFSPSAMKLSKLAWYGKGRET